MSTCHQPDQEAFAAFDKWRVAKLKSDRTMAYADARATAIAWVNFQNLFLGHNEKWPIRNEQLPTASIVPFPRRCQRPYFGGAE